MIQLLFLDTGPLGLITHPKASIENQKCTQWLQSLLHRGVTVVVPEIADYELRREYELTARRSGSRRAIEKLNALNTTLTYLPLDTAAMRRATELWAEVRYRGQPTADDKALDGDVILSAQVDWVAQQANLGREEFVVATTNLKHLEQFVPAKLWHEIHFEEELPAES